MKNKNGQPICGATIEGPRIKTEGGRSHPLWRRNCLRVVKVEGKYCFQHRGEER